MEILPAETTEYDELVALYRQYDFALKERAWFDWKFFANPVGKGLVYKMCQDGAIVGAVAIIPQLFRHENRDIVGLQTVDGLMGREIRGKGKFNQVMAFLRQQKPDWLDGREYFYLSFPSLASSVQAHANAGWTMLGRFKMRTFVMRREAIRRRTGSALLGALSGVPLAAARGLAGATGSGGYDFKPIVSQGAAPSREARVHGDRSQRFCQWRVFDHPRDDLVMFSVEHAKDGPVGCLTVKRRARQWEIVDVCLDRMDRPVLPAFLRWIDHQDQADSVDLWEIRRTILRSRLWYGARRHFTGALFVDTTHAPSLPTDPDLWQISYLDSDW
jgi:hypothetical protein